MVLTFGSGLVGENLLPRTKFSKLIQICMSGIPPKYSQSKTLMYAVKPVNNKVFGFALLHQIHTKVYFKRDLQLLHQISDF